MTLRERSEARIRAFLADPGATAVRLQLADGELRAIHATPERFRPNPGYRAGRRFHLASHADAFWVGGGWWEIRGERQLVVAALEQLRRAWQPVQRELRLAEPSAPPASREVREHYIAHLRAKAAEWRRQG